jgi:hypothetical protein
MASEIALDIVNKIFADVSKTDIIDDIKIGFQQNAVDLIDARKAVVANEIANQLEGDEE